MMKSVQRALPHPDSSWSRNRSPKIEMSSHIQANSTMNQKIDTRTSQSDTAILQARRTNTADDRALDHHGRFRAPRPHPHQAVARMAAPTTGQLDDGAESDD